MAQKIVKPQNLALRKGVVMPRLSPVDKIRTEAIETIFIGVVAENMGYANQSNVVKSGKEVFKKIGSLTYKEFRNIKVLLNGA